MPGTPQRPNEFLCSYEPTTAAIPAARTAFCAWLAEHVHDNDLHDEMAIVLSELVANAVEATEAPHGHVSVGAWLDSGGLTVEVTNPPAATFAAVNRWDYDDPLRTGGRGLLIVESLTDDLAIAPPKGSDPLTIRCHRELPVIP